MLRPKMELMAELGSSEFYRENFVQHRRPSLSMYREVLVDDSHDYQMIETKRNQNEALHCAKSGEVIDTTNPFSMPTMELEGFSCKAQSTER